MSSIILSRRQMLAGVVGTTVSSISSTRAYGAEVEIELHITCRNTTFLGKTAPSYYINDTLPGPTLRWKEGQNVTIHVYNHLDEPTSLHWHGIRVPTEQDGVPGLSYKGIPAGGVFTYHFPVQQSGTYWYHSHSGAQEPFGLSGALIIDPKDRDVLPIVERDYVIFLADWSDVPPKDIISNLKMQSDYYTFRQRSVSSLPQESRTAGGVIRALKDRLMWSKMRMSATDISDVSGVIYQYLLNGRPHTDCWTGLFHFGERVLLRFVNASAMTLFDIRIPGLAMTVVEADGNPVHPVTIDEFRIGNGETYTVLVEPVGKKAYTIFAQSEDRTGYAAGYLSPQHGMAASIPPMDSRPVRSMIDMGMMKPMAGMPAEENDKEEVDEIDDPGSPPLNVENQYSIPYPTDRTASPGDGLEHTGRRVLNYRQLRSLHPLEDKRPPSREIILHLTGNMQRYIWGFNGRKFSESGPIRLRLNERVRFSIINDTMMEHPLHLHGFWCELENGHGQYCPRKHTFISQPGSITNFLITADTPGLWAFHCHLMYHMDTGMFRVVEVA